MGLHDENKEVFLFDLIVDSSNLCFDEFPSVFNLLNHLNADEWMGKAPETCMMVEFKQKTPVPIGETALIDHAEFRVLVGYRPPGWISRIKEDGRQRLNGWKMEVRDQTQDGRLLDGYGNSLEAGCEPIYLPFDIYETADFSLCYFGEIASEA